MFDFTTGNILESGAEAVVNTVNCVGIMGKGIALQFKKAFPANFESYKEACKLGQVKVGKMFVFKTQGVINPKYIINFPTKDHWKGKSRMEYIESGLNDLREVIKYYDLKSIAIPPLGCGLGGLDWQKVKPLIQDKLKDFENVNIIVFEPSAAPKPHDQVSVVVELPPMTKGRALLIGLLNKYRGGGYRQTHLEVQKLMYFIKESGEDLSRLSFVKDKYGPYSDGVRHALKLLEGSYIKGFGDGTQKSEIFVLDNAIEMANEYLRDQTETHQRLEKIAKLIDGFETPFGMELLSTVHWVAKYEGAKSKEEVIEKVKAWNERKAKIMSEDQLSIAFDHLKENKWIFV
ncbi:MAG: macro domain-containing protein [Pseudobdellovibrionaceae bacterium]|nr:macro domain-containing protein [Pseudobdellovibrionaceae bacterium]